MQNDSSQFGIVEARTMYSRHWIHLPFLLAAVSFEIVEPGVLKMKPIILVEEFGSKVVRIRSVSDNGCLNAGCCSLRFDQVSIQACHLPGVDVGFPPITFKLTPGCVGGIILKRSINEAQCLFAGVSDRRLPKLALVDLALRGTALDNSTTILDKLSRMP